MPGPLFLDFEFNRITHPKVNLVSCSTLDGRTGEQKKWWLHNDPKAQTELKKYLTQYKLFIGYSMIAECRSMLALGMDPLKFQHIDLFLEYRCLTNHNDDLQWGKQLVDGKVKMVFKKKPKWEREEGEEEGGGFKATHSLAEAQYKLLNTIRDTAHKNKMRELIISDPQLFTTEERDAIMDYNMDDVTDLPGMLTKMTEAYLSLDGDLTKDQLFKEMKIRGRYAAHTSIMENRGYPIDIDKARNFSTHVGNILYDLQREINGLFPDIKPFRWNRAEQKFSWDQIATRNWISKSKFGKDWDLTEKGQISLSLESFEKFFQFKHDYPTDSFGAQMVRFLKMKQSLYGFVPAADKKKKNFWDFVGPDNRVRPYMNIYGAQSSRSQPGATGFMFLKPAWMRALVQPAPGMAMAGIDYGSQEFFVSALISGDENMINAYLSGDPYFAFAKLAGAVPQDAKKEDHKAMRDLFKSTVLGLSYLMSKYGLSIKLTQDTGQEWTVEQAEEQIEKFYDVFFDLKNYQEWLIEEYKATGMIKLPCGWRMWGDNPNFRSVTNVPIQGFGASVMRKAVDLAVEKGLYVCKTLHDALYIEYPVGEEWQIVALRDAMREAFVFYFEEKETKQLASRIRLDPFAWSPDYEDDGELVVGDMKIPCGKLYIDERAITDYKNFSKYFEKSQDQDL